MVNQCPLLPLLRLHHLFLVCHQPVTRSGIVTVIDLAEPDGCCARDAVPAADSVHHRHHADPSDSSCFGAVCSGGVCGCFDFLCVPDGSETFRPQPRLVCNSF
uniref:Putative secreted protein n=1 Tax=Anopheles triannulatus TaxID=58253 RepID=A0A2M4B3P8_9DIPT